MFRTFTRADGSTFTPYDPDPSVLAVTIHRGVEAGSLRGLNLTQALDELRQAERMWLARTIHEGDQYQDGGSHPNTYDLDGCGTCSRLIEG